MKKTKPARSSKKTGPARLKKKLPDIPRTVEKSVGSANAFDATERPRKETEKELSDEQLDGLIDDLV